MSDYVYDRIKEEPLPPAQIEVVEFQKPAEISFSLTVEDDSTGRRKEFSYEGPAEAFKEVSVEIERLWNEE